MGNRCSRRIVHHERSEGSAFSPRPANSRLLAPKPGARNDNSRRRMTHVATRIHYTRCLTRIPVQTPSRSYEVLVERGLLRSAGQALRDILPAQSRGFVVTSPRIRKLWGGVLTKSFSRAGRKVE